MLYDQLRASLHGSAKTTSAFQGTKDTEPKKYQHWKSSDKGRVEDEFSSVTVEEFARGAIRLLPVEDSPYGDSDDQGMCLSMHQPWASLLVAGFKRAEGRSWSHPHRGRLWIHAAGKEPEQEEIEMLEAQYRSIYGDQGVAVPALPSKSSGYPTSVLLGCVDVEECWSNEEYKEVLRKNPTMPQEENDSEFIFWCLRPRRLQVPLRMGGEHKIWKLPKLSLQAGQLGLQPVRWPAPAEGESVASRPSLGLVAKGCARAAAGAAAAADRPRRRGVTERLRTPRQLHSSRCAAAARGYDQGDRRL